MAPKAQKQTQKEQTPAPLTPQPEEVPSSPPPSSPPASPKKKQATKTQNQQNGSVSGAEKTPKKSPAKKNSPPSSDSEPGNGDLVEKKLSAVPMPLVKKVKEQLGSDISFKNMSELKTILESFIHVIVDSTMKGDSVTLPNYMTFKRVLRNERTHMNPKTKEKIVKPAHYVLSMYVKAQLKKEFEELTVTEEDMQKTLPKSPKNTQEKEALPVKEETQ